MPPVERFAPSLSLRERVEDALAHAISSGEMAAGELYSAPSIAARYGVSATPVREAMLNLEKRGFVETVRNKGFRVTSVSDQDLAEIVDVRLLLEPPAMRRLAGSVPTGAVADLRAAAELIVDRAAAGDLVRYLAADAAFHGSLTALLGNRHLTEVVLELRGQTRLPGLAAIVGSQELRTSATEHHELLDLLLAADGEGAEELMRRHISHVLGWWSGRPETA